MPCQFSPRRWLPLGLTESKSNATARQPALPLTIGMHCLAARGSFRPLHPIGNEDVKDSKALLLEYLASVRDPERAASLFAEDGAFELHVLRSLGSGRASTTTGRD